MLKTSLFLPQIMRRVFTGCMLIVALCGASTSARAEEYWRGRNHPQPRQIIHPHYEHYEPRYERHERCERNWRPMHHYRHHHGHHHPRYTRIIVQPPMHRHPPVIYLPHRDWR